MMEIRWQRLTYLLAESGYSGYLSASPADIRYLTGSEDASGWCLFASSPASPTIRLVVRPSALDHARDTVVAGVEVQAHNLTDDPADVLAGLSARLGWRGRVATCDIGPSIMAALAQRSPTVQFEQQPDLSRQMRRHKDADEMENIRRAAAIADAATAAALAAIRVGATELEAAAALESVARRMGCEGDLRVIQVKGGPRSAYPDALAGTRHFVSGDMGYIDLGIFYRGYLGDMTRAFAIGEIGAAQRHLLETVDRVQTEIKGMVQPGMAGRDLYLAARDALAAAGYPNMPPHHLGHGVGLLPDAPRLAIDSADVLQVGDVFTIEPGVYVPGVGGIRIEDVVVLGTSGIEVLSKHPRVTFLVA